MHPVQLGDGAVEQVLVPAPELVDALDGAGGVGFEVLDHRIDVGAREDALRHLSHRVLDAVQLVPSPRVRLVEIERDAVEVLRVQRVPLAPDRIVFRGVGRVLVDQETTERRVRLGGTHRQRFQPVAEGTVTEARRVVVVDQREKERAGRSVDRTPGIGLSGTRHRLAARRDDALGRAFGEGCLDAGEPLRYERHPLGDGLPVVGGLVGHQVEGHAHGLHGTPQHAQVAEPFAGVVLHERELQAFAHDLGGDPVGVGHEVDGRERAQRRPVVVGALGCAVGREVGHLVVVTGDAFAGRTEGVEDGEALDVLFRQLVDR